MFDQILSQFGQSKQGQMAYQALQAQGFGGQHAASILNAALPAAAQAMRGAARGDRSSLPSLSDSNYIMNFTAAAFSGLIRGQGFAGSAIDGFQGVVGGYVAQVLAARFGLPKRTAGVLGAIVTPLAIDFLWEKLEQQTGAMAEAAAAPAPVAALPAPAVGYGYGYAHAALPAATHGAHGYGGPPAPAAAPAHAAYGYAHYPGQGAPAGPAAYPSHAGYAPPAHGHGAAWGAPATYTPPAAQYAYNPYERR